MARIRPVTRLRAGSSSVSGAARAEHTGTGLLGAASSGVVGSGTVTGEVENPLDLPIVPQEELASLFTYVGRVRAPSPANYGGPALGVFAGAAYTQPTDNPMALCRFSIPTIGQQGTTLVGETSIPGRVAPGASNPDHCSGTLIHSNGRLYITAHNTYDNSQSQRYWIKSADPNLTNFGPWCGMNGSHGTYVRLLSGGLFPIPEIWQPILGGNAAALGNKGDSIVSNACCGYGFGAFWLEDVPDEGDDGEVDIDVLELLNYPHEHSVDPDQNDPRWNSWPKNSLGGVDYWSLPGQAHGGCLIIEGSRTLCFITCHAYGAPNSNVLNCNPSSSVHADPHRVQIVAYDLQDLVDVKNEAKDPWEPYPYCWVHLPNWNSSNVWGPAAHADGQGNCVGVGNDMACGFYDAPNSRYYMSANPFWEDRYIHCWDVAPYEGE